MTDTATVGANEPAVHGCPVIMSCGQRVLLVPRERWFEVTRALVADGFDMLVDLTGVDYLLVPGRTVGAGVDPERFEVVVNLLSISRRERLRLRTQVPESDPVLASLFDLHPGAHRRGPRARNRTPAPGRAGAAPRAGTARPRPPPGTRTAATTAAHCRRG